MRHGRLDDVRKIGLVLERKEEVCAPSEEEHRGGPQDQRADRPVHDGHDLARAQRVEERHLLQQLEVKRGDAEGLEEDLDDRGARWVEREHLEEVD